jgi:hypothetical protein
VVPMRIDRRVGRRRLHLVAVAAIVALVAACGSDDDGGEVHYHEARERYVAAAEAGLVPFSEWDLQGLDPWAIDGFGCIDSATNPARWDSLIYDYGGMRGILPLISYHVSYCRGTDVSQLAETIAGGGRGIITAEQAEILIAPFVDLLG